MFKLIITNVKMEKRYATRRAGRPASSGEDPEPIPLRFRDDPHVWAAWLYFRDGMTQNGIAEVMGVSRATVNGYLAEARARGIVSINIDPARLGAVSVAQALKQRFQLADCVVIPTDGGARPLITRLGEAGAAVLQSLLRPGDTLAVAWGRTIMAVGANIGPMRIQDVSVIQATGGTTATFDFSPELCASRVAAGIGARCINLLAPAVVSNAVVRDVLVNEPIVHEQLEIARRADKLIFGVCTTGAGSLIYTSGLFDQADAAYYLRLRGTAVVAGRFMDENGTPLHGPLDDRMIGLSLEEIARIKVRIAVAGGIDKVSAIRACLKGGHATILVTDEVTARGMLKAESALDITSDSLPRADGTPEIGRTSMKTKKLINDPNAIIEEMLEGIVAAHPRHLRQLEQHSRAIVARSGPRPGKVGLVIGGGSGHEPMFLGFVGKGLADAAAVGNVFASPPPDPIYECAKAVDGGQGVLFMYGNYAGDVMNFDMAVEMAAADGIKVHTVLTTDDVASAPPERKKERRGVAGNFFIFKVAGAACDAMWSLDECERAARKANDRTYTMGVALAPCSLPHTLKHNFEIGPGDMEIGMGIHGEPGVAREPLKNADAVTDEILDRIFTEMPAKRGDKVALLVNSLGSTSLMELYVMNRRVRQRLDAKGISIHATWVGNYCTSLEMAGASISLMLLDGELIQLLDRPCDCAMFRVP
jgi:dihydroxyacetone kinase-like protein